MKHASLFSFVLTCLLAAPLAQDAGAAKPTAARRPAARAKRSPEHRALVTRARRAMRARARASANQLTPEATRAKIESLHAQAQTLLDRARQIEDRAIDGASDNLPLDAALAGRLRTEAATYLDFKLTKETTGTYRNPLRGHGSKEMDFGEGPKLEKAYERALAEWTDSYESDDQRVLEASRLRMTPRTRALSHWSILSRALVSRDRTIQMDGADGAWSFDRSRVAESDLVDHRWEPAAGNTITIRRGSTRPVVSTSSRLAGWSARGGREGWEDTGADSYKNGKNRGVAELEATFGPHLEKAFASLGGRDAVIDVGTGGGRIAESKIGTGTGARVIGIDLEDRGASEKATPGSRFSFVKGNIRAAGVRRQVLARSKRLKRKVLIDAFGPLSWDPRPDEVLESYGELLDAGGQAFIQLPPPGRYWVYPESGRGKPTEYGDYLVDKLQSATGWKVDFSGFVTREKQGRERSARVLVLTRTEGPARIPAKLSPLAASRYQPSSTFTIPMLPRAWIAAD
jgi:SAM-dependent methyltransferase